MEIMEMGFSRGIGANQPIIPTQQTTYQMVM
jgi:hypothetical protein